MRTTATREVTARPRRIAFRTLLTAVATAFAVMPGVILAPGQQRALVPARELLVHLAHDWGHLSTRELGQQLRRDPSMISHLATAYAAHRDLTTETHIRHAITSHHAQISQYSCLTPSWT